MNSTAWFTCLHISLFLLKRSVEMFVGTWFINKACRRITCEHAWIKSRMNFKKLRFFISPPPICPLQRKPDLGDFQQLGFEVWESISISELLMNFSCFSLRTTVFQFLLSSRLGYLWYSSCKRLWERILTRFVCSPPTALFSHLLPLKAIEIIEMYFKKVFKRKCNIHQLVKENVILIN